MNDKWPFWLIYLCGVLYVAVTLYIITLIVKAAV